MMMVWLKRILKFFAWTLGVVLVLIIGFGVYVYYNASFAPPNIATDMPNVPERTKINDSTYTLNNNWLTKNEFGHYVMYTEGDAITRGVANGKLSKELIVGQEIAFTHQIKKMIPSDKYLKFLKYIIGFMNRGLPEHVNEEFQQEIYGIAQASSDSFDWIGDKFSRQMNYHAAHDIGHALQNMMLVGCTSFGVWDKHSANGQLLIGRNFDFWVGDEFAQNKVVSIVRPDKGYPFAFVTWGAFIGVSSGMNSEGITVTINAAKSSIPFNAATPVSLVAREILQYASNIEEAKKIAKSRTMFVSESFLVGSGKEQETIVIEKTPTEQDVYSSTDSKILCANHFQSNRLGNETLNLEQKAQSASLYRQERLLQLVHDSVQFTPIDVAAVLRDTKGINGTDIGLGNEKSINQLVAHHSVIFQPEELLMWVSSEPWQMGTYVCYDLKKVFAERLPVDASIIAYDKNIAPDSTFIASQAFQDFLKFRTLKNNFTFDKTFDFNPQQLINYNPQYYDAYRIAGDYYSLKNMWGDASTMYQRALEKEIATKNEAVTIEQKMNKAHEALKK